MHPISALFVVGGLLCAGSLGSVLASEYGDEPNPQAVTTMKPLAGNTETINTENRSSAMDQDKEISLKMKSATPMSSPEPLQVTHASDETLSQYMLDLVESQNEKAALGF